MKQLFSDIGQRAALIPTERETGSEARGILACA